MRKVVWALIVVVGLVGVAWALDVYARATTEDRIAAEVVATTGGEPTVAVEGFAFLTQLAAGELEHLEIDIPALTLEGIALEDAHVVALGVATSDPTTIRSLTATATVPIAEIDRLFKEASGLSADIEVRGESMAITGEVLGQELAVLFRPALADGGLTLTAESLALGDRELDISLLEGLFSGIAGDLLLPLGLPEGLRIAAIEVLPDGVHLQVDGTDFTPDEAMFR